MRPSLWRDVDVVQLASSENLSIFVLPCFRTPAKVLNGVRRVPPTPGMSASGGQADVN